MGKAYEKKVKVERGIRWLQKREQDYANMDKISRCGMWNVAPLRDLLESTEQPSSMNIQV